MRVVRDKVTKQMRLMWDESPAEFNPNMTIEIDDHEEMVDLPQMSQESAMEIIKIKAQGKKHKRVLVHNDRIEVETEDVIPEDSTQPVIAVLDDMRKKKGKKSNESLTWADIQEASQRLLGGQ